MIERIVDAGKKALWAGTLVGAALLAPMKQAYSDMIISSHVYDGSTEVTTVTPNKTYRLELGLDSTQDPNAFIKSIIWENYPSSDGGFTQTSGVIANMASRPTSNDLFASSIVSTDPSYTVIDTNFAHTNFITATSGFPSNSNKPFVDYSITFDAGLVGKSVEFYLQAVDVRDTTTKSYTLADENLQTDYTIVDVSIQGDANKDGKVDGADLALWQQNYDPLGINKNTWKMGDWNVDGKIDGGDLALWQQHYDPIGIHSSVVPGQFSDVQSSQVPEPATLFLLGTGVLGLAGALRRKEMK